MIECIMCVHRYYAKKEYQSMQGFQLKYNSKYDVATCAMVNRVNKVGKTVCLSIYTLRQ